MSTNLNINTNTVQRRAISHAAFILTSTGTGAGVSTITLTVSENMTLSLSAVGKFYTDAAGTLGESSTWDITTGAPRTMYLKVTSGTSLLSIPKNKIISWGVWTSGANAANLSGDISKLTVLTTIVVNGNNTISGNAALMPGLTFFRMLGSNTISGSIAGLTSLTGIVVTGSNTLSGAMTALTSLTFINITGSNTVSGDLNPIVSGLTQCSLSPCAMVDYTAGATWGNATIIINPSAGFGYDATEIDNMLIDMAASVALISKVITLQGQNAARTAASNAAVATLEGVGRLCTVITNP